MVSVKTTWVRRTGRRRRTLYLLRLVSCSDTFTMFTRNFQAGGVSRSDTNMHRMSFLCSLLPRRLTTTLNFNNACREIGSFLKLHKSKNTERPLHHVALKNSSWLFHLVSALLRRKTSLLVETHGTNSKWEAARRHLWPERSIVQKQKHAATVQALSTSNFCLPNLLSANQITVLLLNPNTINILHRRTENIFFVRGCAWI